MNIKFKSGFQITGVDKFGRIQYNEFHPNRITGPCLDMFGTGFFNQNSNSPHEIGVGRSTQPASSFDEGLIDTSPTWKVIDTDDKVWTRPTGNVVAVFDFLDAVYEWNEVGLRNTTGDLLARAILRTPFNKPDTLRVTTHWDFNISELIED